MEDASVRVEKRYLGHFTIPLVTIFRENRVEGVFRLETPLFNVGYQMKPNEVTTKKISSNSPKIGTGNGTGTSTGGSISSGLDRNSAGSGSQEDDQLMGCVALCCPSLYECAKVR